MIVTRIAPSPTGPLHIGTARTALFNYLFAKKNKGQFLLRFEDTDRSRSTLENEKEIEEGLKWLGLNWDKGSYRQMERLKIYQKAAKKLMEKGFAKKDKGAVILNAEVVFKKLCKDEEKGKELKIEGKAISQVKELGKDEIHGEINGLIYNSVLLRSNGLPTFHLAVVVDDAEMKVTYVIRGDDHLSNTPLHILLQRALGYPTPRYAHIPLILNPDRSKMSKRQGMVAIREFREAGYLPEAMLNFLALLGWNPKTDREIFTLKELIQEFSLEGIQKSAAIFDQTKLNSFNKGYLSKCSVVNLAQRLKKFWQETKVSPPPFKEKELLKLLEMFKDRMTTLSDFLPLIKESKKLKDHCTSLLIFKKSDKANSRQGIESAMVALEKINENDWQKEKLLEVLAGVVKNENLENGDVFWPTRVALSGLKKSPPPEELLFLVGKKESLKRLKKAIDKLK